MTATALATDVIAVNELDAASQTLQELTETAVSDRESATLLAAELAVPAVKLAQDITEQLHAYGFDKESLVIEDGDRKRMYKVVTAYRSRGLVRRHSITEAVCLCLCDKNDYPVWPLWDPFEPERAVDSEGNARTSEIFIPGLGWRRCYLAGARTLAQWAKDAQPLLELVRERERRRVQHLREGLAASENTIIDLNL